MCNRFDVPGGGITCIGLEIVGLLVLTGVGRWVNAGIFEEMIRRMSITRRC
jgi:hypothetical protein